MINGLSYYNFGNIRPISIKMDKEWDDRKIIHLSSQESAFHFDLTFEPHPLCLFAVSPGATDSPSFLFGSPISCHLMVQRLPSNYAFLSETSFGDPVGNSVVFAGRATRRLFKFLEHVRPKFSNAVCQTHRNGPDFCVGE